MRPPFLRFPLAHSLAVLLACLLPVGQAAAVSLDELYRAEVEVTGKDGQARADGFRRALERVLVKVSGSTAVGSNPDAEELLESPAGFVQQYRYERIENAGAGAAASGDEESPPTHRLSVEFAKGRIDQALHDRGIVIWGERRPEILVWLAVDDGDERTIVGTDGDSEAHDRLVQRARQRALPTMLPLMDMQDRARVDFVDIQGGFLDAVAAASERYRANAYLIGHVRRRGGGWQGDWNLMGVGERQSWRTTAADMEGAVDGGVDGATERVAAAFAGRGEEPRELRLRVADVAGLDAYARVSKYLASLVRVRSAEVVQLRPREAIFRVTMHGRIEDLERAITLGSTLARVQSAGSGDGAIEDAVRADRSGADPTREDGAPADGGAGTGADEPPAHQGEAEAGVDDRGPAMPRDDVDLTFRLVG